MCGNGVRMNIERLFHVLVLGGAAIAACSDGKPDDTAEDDGGVTNGAGGSGSGATVTSASTGGGTTGSGGSAGAGGIGGSGTGDGGTAGGAAGGGGDEPTCSDPASPTDPCGCPCCWANCPNTDEACCGGFCASGNDGAGCCGL